VFPLAAPLLSPRTDLTDQFPTLHLYLCHDRSTRMQVEEVGQAHPRILETVENMVKKGKWTVPGYKEKFGDLSLM